VHLVGFCNKTVPVGPIPLPAHDDVTNESSAAEMESLQGK